MKLVYVTDPNGWDAGCPDYDGVFFGTHPGAEYIHPKDGGMSPCGHIVADDLVAEALYDEYSTTGDWITPHGVEARPSYGIESVSEV